MEIVWITPKKIGCNHKFKYQMNKTLLLIGKKLIKANIKLTSESKRYTGILNKLT